MQALHLRIRDDRGAEIEREFPLQWDCDRNLQFRVFNFPVEELKGRLQIHGRFIVENRSGKTASWITHNFPGLEAQPLVTARLKEALPYPLGWQAGEMHCHSEYSSDPVEFGAPLELLQQAADVAGLDFVLCTDHSYDFYYRRDRYLEPCEARENFGDYRLRASALNQAHPEFPILIPGEEVSCGNSRGENVHLLVFGHEEFLPGLGDGGRRGFNNRPDLALPEVLERLQGTPCFAAHPKAKIGWLERKIFRRGQWHDEDASPQPLRSGTAASIQGLQFWNGNLGSDYRTGKEFWIRRLLAGQRLLPIAANDAHGDFNRNIGVKFPMLSLYQGRNHVFGKVRTVVPCASNRPEALRQSFGGARCLCTDGPFVEIQTTDRGVHIQAKSTDDFGTLQSVVLYSGQSGDREERLARTWTLATGSMEFDEKYDGPLPSRGYMRAEAATRQGRRALTSAIFVG